MATERPQVDEPIAPEWQAEAEEQRRRAAEIDAANPHMAEIWHQRTLKALAQVDAGERIDDEDMQVWLESLGTDHELPEPQPRWCASAGPPTHAQTCVDSSHTWHP